MTPQDIVAALQGRGWEASTATAGEVNLVDVGPDGLLKCVDGRLSDQPGMNGPKALGGVYAIASLRGVRDLDGLKKIVQEVKDAGYVPSVHGDDHADPAPMGCGYFKLWSTGKLPGFEPPEYDSEQGKAAALEAGAVYEQLKGSHAETEVLINLIPKKTLEPQEDQRFVVDGWILEEFKIDVVAYLIKAAETVELLGGPKKARIIVPESAPIA